MTSQRSNPTSIPRTFAELWDRAVHDHPDRPFLLFRAEDGDLSNWTYREFDDIVDGVAARLTACGVGPGSPVHLVLRNCPAFVAVWLATSRLGAWMVPVDPASSARDVALQVGRTRPVVTVCAGARLDAVVDGIAQDAPERVPAVLALTETAADLAPGSPLVAAPALTRSGPPRPQDRIAVMFTSGTTSEPKGVELTQRNYLCVATAMAELAGLSAEDRWYVCLPLFHANAQYYCFASAIAVAIPPAAEKGAAEPRDCCCCCCCCCRRAARQLSRCFRIQSSSARSKPMSYPSRSDSSHLCFRISSRSARNSW